MLAKHVLYQLSYAPSPTPPVALETLWTASYPYGLGMPSPSTVQKGCDEPEPMSGFMLERALAGR